MNMTPEVLAALSEAARLKGSPLNDAERAAVYGVMQKDYWRVRFTNVIRGAGYKNDAPERICAEYLDEYLKDLPSFRAMLEEYERDNASRAQWLTGVQAV